MSEDKDVDKAEIQIPSTIVISDSRPSEPSVAPVTDPEPLTGKEKAGVSLTWGIISILVFFLIVILFIFWWGESTFLTHLNQLSSESSTPEKLKELTQLTEIITSQQKDFRAFWLDVLQLILLNVLFPTLTALLGYVFGTSRNGNGNET